MYKDGSDEINNFKNEFRSLKIFRIDLLNRIVLHTFLETPFVLQNNIIETFYINHIRLDLVFAQ